MSPCLLLNTTDAPLSALPSDPLQVNGGLYRLVLGTKQGAEVYDIQMRHSHIITYRSPHGGADRHGLHARGSPDVRGSGEVRCNGEVGVGLYDRVARTETLYFKES